MAVKGGVMGSIGKLSSSMKRGSGSSSVQFLSDGQEVDVRFLTEPDKWFEFFEHYDPVRRFFPCMEDDCEGCEAGTRPSQRYLANTLVDGKVVAFKIPVSQAEVLLKYYKKYGTLLDRDYELSREGSGQNDTTYMAIPGSTDRKPFNVGRYDLLDLGGILEDIAGGGDDDEDEEDDVPTAKRRRVVNRGATKRTRRAVAGDDDDDPDDEPPARSSRTPLKKPGQARREKEAPQRRVIKKAGTPVRRPVRRSR